MPLFSESTIRSFKYLPVIFIIVAGDAFYRDSDVGQKVIRFFTADNKPSATNGSFLDHLRASTNRPGFEQRTRATVGKELSKSLGIEPTIQSVDKEDFGNSLYLGVSYSALVNGEEVMAKAGKMFQAEQTFQVDAFCSKPSSCENLVELYSRSITELASNTEISESLLPTFPGRRCEPVEDSGAGQNTGVTCSFADGSSISIRRDSTTLK